MGACPNCEGLHSYNHDDCQVAVSEGSLKVKVDTSVVLDRSFAYPVRNPMQPEDLDWEVTQDENGCV